MITTEVDRKPYMGSCRLCGARLLYNREEDRLEKRGGDPDCACELETEEEGEKDGETDN